MNGTFDGKNLILNEDFIWNDGEIQKRSWTIKKVENNRYEGNASDVVVTAQWLSMGSAFNFKYKLMIPYKGKKIKVSWF